ncbi:hypothetical protein VN97_g12147, partial [Penicillium thymicola]
SCHSQPSEGRIQRPARVIRINRSLDNSINMLNKDLKLRKIKERKFKQKCVSRGPRSAMWTWGDGEGRKKKREKWGGRGYLYLPSGLMQTGKPR